MADKVIFEFLIEEYDKFGVSCITASVIDNKEELLSNLNTEREDLIALSDENDIALYDSARVDVDEYRARLSDFNLPLITLLGIVRDIKRMSSELNSSEDRVINTLLL
ncbi:hypothetical protein [Cytobacillus gottheilii]|uniref:hypothetical protein n=1 Tax=Cytobacillus gottheilii TaxID=859144 RepID=UPI0009B9BC6D|nr:hypothetical protein [Cytobacillus gottheilii]